MVSAAAITPGWHRHPLSACCLFTTALATLLIPTASAQTMEDRARAAAHASRAKSSDSDAIQRNYLTPGLAGEPIATIDNSQGLFKPEMFTTVTIYTEEGDSSIGVARDAVIYEADNARVWVARSDKTIELRQIKTGITRGNVVQVVQGLRAGEIVVTKGSLFVDQAAGT